jgi:hypothetical protein
MEIFRPSPSKTPKIDPPYFYPTIVNFHPTSNLAEEIIAAAKKVHKLSTKNFTSRKTIIKHCQKHEKFQSF